MIAPVKTVPLTFSLIDLQEKLGAKEKLHQLYDISGEGIQIPVREGKDHSVEVKDDGKTKCIRLV
jgi:hypothetical protein